MLLWTDVKSAMGPSLLQTIPKVLSTSSFLPLNSQLLNQDVSGHHPSPKDGCIRPLAQKNKKKQAMLLYCLQ
jgi:hypothetical protein